MPDAVNGAYQDASHEKHLRKQRRFFPSRSDDIGSYRYPEIIRITLVNIFVTVGAQMPFERLVTGVDLWAKRNRTASVFAQIGSTNLPPSYIEFVSFLEPVEFRARVKWAHVLVAHAGMGSILTALQYGKPILIMPRRASFRETRNDHQVATAERFLELGKVSVSMDETQLSEMLSKLDMFAAAEPISAYASGDLITALREFIVDGD